MKIALQIRFGDIDRFGHITNSVYFQFFDIGRLDFIQNYLPNIEFEDKTLVLVHVGIDYLQSTYAKDNIFVETKLEKIGNKSISLVQYIIDDKDNIKAKSRCVLSTLDMKTNKSFPMPEKWQIAFEKAIV